MPTTTHEFLYEALQNYAKLLDVTYHLTLKDVGCIAEERQEELIKAYENEVCLQFEKENFFHFLGIQHAENDVLLQYKKRQLQFYDKVENRKINNTILFRSKNYSELLERITFVNNIEKILNSFTSLYDWDKKFYYYSQDRKLKEKEKIRSANLFLDIPLSEKKAFVFFSLLKIEKNKKKKKNVLMCNPCSIIITNDDFTLNHKQLVLLIKVRNKITGEFQVLYINPQYFVLHPEKMIVEKNYLKEHKEVLEMIISKIGVSSECKEKAQALLIEFQVQEEAI